MATSVLVARILGQQVTAPVPLIRITRVIAARPAPAPRIAITRIWVAFGVANSRVKVAGVRGVVIRVPRVAITRIQGAGHSGAPPYTYFIYSAGAFSAPLLWVRSGSTWVDIGQG